MKTFFGYSKDDKMVADWEKYFTFSNRTFVCIRDNVEEWEYLYGNKDAYNGTSKKHMYAIYKKT